MPKGIYGKVGESGVINDPPHSEIERLHLIQMEGLPDDSNASAQKDGTWAVTGEKKEELYKADLKKFVDPENLHISKHERLGETEEAAEALQMFKIAKAKVDEKYGKGSKVYVTGSGSCYHLSKDCSTLTNATEIIEINLSEGLENYSPCSICCN